MALLIVSVILFNTAAFLMRKRLSPLEMWTTCLFAIVLECVSDLALDLKLQLFGYFDVGVQWASFLAIFGIYPAVSALFLNFYPFTKSWISKVSYIIGWSCFSVLYEILTTQSGYFYYNNWKLWYSALCYPVLLVILLADLMFIRRLKLMALHE